MPPSHHYWSHLAAQPVCFCFNWVTFWVDCDGQGLKDHRRLICPWEKQFGLCEMRKVLGALRKNTNGANGFTEYKLMEGGDGKERKEKQEDLIFGSGWGGWRLLPLILEVTKIRGAWAWCLWILKTKKIFWWSRLSKGGLVFIEEGPVRMRYFMVVSCSEPVFLMRCRYGFILGYRFA